MGENIKDEGDGTQGKKAKGSPARPKKSGTRTRAKKIEAPASKAMPEPEAPREAQLPEEVFEQADGKAEASVPSRASETAPEIPDIDDPEVEGLHRGPAEERRRPREAKAEDFITFNVDGAPYALRALEVDEVLRIQPVTTVPGSASHVLGITSLRGLIIPVVDLSVMLSGKAGTGGGDKVKILVLKNGESPVGLKVDRKLSMVSATPEDRLHTPSHIRKAAAHFLEGVLEVDGQFVSIIKTNEILSINAAGRANEKS